MPLMETAKAILGGGSRQYLLPSTEKSRKLWEAKAPKGYEKSGSDYVKYHATTDDTPMKDGKPSHGNAACYASCRPGFDKYDMTCMPLQKKGVVDLNEAWDFFIAMTECGAFPEGIQLWEEKDGVHCHIPKGVGNPHNIYAALVGYRLIDSCPPFIWDFNHIMSQEGQRHPLQIFPYLVGKHSIGGGHCFMNVGTYGSGVLGQSVNPVLGLAAKIYFDLQDGRGADEYAKHSTYVNSAIATVAKAITPTLKIKSGKEAWAANVDTPRYVLEKPEDGLSPDLYELYTTPQISNKQIEAFLADRFTKEKK